MSIALLIEEVNNVKINKLLPISGEKNFIHQWLPICERKKLEWIPIFETGGQFTEEDIPFILNELSSIMSVIKDKVEMIHMQERIILLVKELRDLQNEKTVFYIG